MAGGQHRSAPLMAIGHVENLARSPVAHFGGGALTFGALGRNGRATGALAGPGGRPGGRPLVARVDQ